MNDRDTPPRAQIANAEILALGEGLIEFVRLDETREGRPLYRQGFGGDTSNALISAARQGGRAAYVTAVGGDPFGRDLLALWKTEGISTEHVHIRENDPTGVYFVQPHRSGRSFSYARRGSAASLFGAGDIPVRAIETARVLHVSAISQAVSTTMREAVTRAAEIARSAGTLVSYDTNLRLNMWPLQAAREAITAFLPLADIVFPSDDEAAQLTGLREPQAVAEYFLGFGASQVLLKRGEKGAVLTTPDWQRQIAPVRVDAIDSTGAGDSFAGAYLAYFLETGDCELAARRAVKVAAATVSGLGAIDPIPYREAVVAN